MADAASVGSDAGSIRHAIRSLVDQKDTKATICIVKVGQLVLLCRSLTIEIARPRHHRERVGEGMERANRVGNALYCSVLRVAAADRNDTAKMRC